MTFLCLSLLDECFTLLISGLLAVVACGGSQSELGTRVGPDIVMVSGRVIGGSWGRH